MPELSAEGYAKVAAMLDDLKPHIDDIEWEPARNFVQDQIDRIAEYGPRMFMSEKQVNWLTRIHNEQIGTNEPGTGGSGVDLDIDDEVPF